VTSSGEACHARFRPARTTAVTMVAVWHSHQLLRMNLGMQCVLALTDGVALIARSGCAKTIAMATGSVSTVAVRASRALKESPALSEWLMLSATAKTDVPSSAWGNAVVQMRWKVPPLGVRATRIALDNALGAVWMETTKCLQPWATVIHLSARL
jgi:hypothetical protein